MERRLIISAVTASTDQGAVIDTVREISEILCLGAAARWRTIGANVRPTFVVRNRTAAVAVMSTDLVCAQLFVGGATGQGRQYQNRWNYDGATHREESNH